MIFNLYLFWPVDYYRHLIGLVGRSGKRLRCCYGRIVVRKGLVSDSCKSKEFVAIEVQLWRVKAAFSKWRLLTFFNASSSQSDNGEASSPACRPGNNKPSSIPMRQPVVLPLNCPCSGCRCNKSPPDFLSKREQPDFVR